MKTTGILKLLIIFLVPLALSIGACRNPFRTHDDAFTSKGLLTLGTDDIAATGTRVEGHLEVPIRPGTNILWCGTFQLAWNETCKLIGEDISLIPGHPMIPLMNRKSFTAKHLDDECYVALAGFVRDGIYKKIDKALKDKFKGQASPRHKPPLLPRPQDIVAYAYLFKNMEFEKPFERLRKPIVFNGLRIAGFGMGEEYKPGHAQLCPQISILDYRSPDDFIVELKSESEGDRILLAKIQPDRTLSGTIRNVGTRIADAEPSNAVPGDVLKVPKLNFDITRRFREIEGHRLVAKNPDVAKDLLLLSAVQNTRFQMDEKGVRLRSEAHLAFGCAAVMPPEPRHIMIFDKPFLIMLQRTDAEMPYFALWVGNSNILVRE